MSYRDDEQVVHGVDELRDAVGEHSTDEDGGCLVWLVIGLILLVSGAAVLGIILALIAFGGWLVGVFS